MSPSIRRSDGTETTLAAGDVERLRAGLHGALLTPESDAYDEARSIWNAMIDRRPALIVRCADADDVAHTVRFARERDLLLAVRGGGHNIAGNALADGGIVVDLSTLRRIAVDALRRTARVEAGATLADVDRETQRYGLATPLGINSTTGVAGLTLGGGFGWLSRRFGLSIDNLLAAELVLASGERVRVSEMEDPDLFWGIRGGGGNFGAVTSFDFRLHDVGPEVLSGLIIHPIADAPAVLRYYREFMASAPEEVVTWFVLRQAPPLPVLPTEWHGREILALAVCCSAPLERAERLVRPLREQGRPIADLIAPHPYTAWQQVLDPLLAKGARNYWKSHDFAELTDGLIDTLVDWGNRIPDPQSELAFAQLGGAVARVPSEATAYSHRDGKYVLNVHGRWADPAKDEQCIGWARDVFRATAPFATGAVYVNFLTQEESDRIPAAYGAGYARLASLKQRVDPSNLFRVNQNIRPSGMGAPAYPAAEPAPRAARPS